MHASALARFSAAYEHVAPESVGNLQHVLVSELAGKASLVSKARALGIDLSDDPQMDQEILDDVKRRE